MKVNNLQMPSTGFSSPLMSYWTLAILMLCCMIYSLLNARYFFYFGDTVTYVSAIENLFNFRPDLLRTPVYPLVISSFASFLGESGTCLGIYILQWVVFFISAIYFRKTAAILMPNSSRVIFVATSCYGLWQYIWGFNVCVLTESLSISFTVFFVWSIIKCLSAPSIRYFVISATWIFVIAFLRPAFIYLFFVYAMILIVLTFSKQRKSIVRPIIVGYMSFFCIIGFQVAYIKSMETNYGIRTTSVVSLTNNLYSLRECKAIKSKYAENAVLKNVIDSCITDTPSRGLDLNEELGCILRVASAPELEDFEKRALADNIKEYIWNIYFYRYVLDMSHRELENHYGAQPSLIYILPPTVFINNILVFCLMYALWVLWSMRKTHRIEICPIVLWMTVMGLGAVTLIGAMAEFSRLIVPIISVVILMMAQMLSHIKISRLT